MESEHQGEGELFKEIWAMVAGFLLAIIGVGATGMSLQRLLIMAAGAVLFGGIWYIHQVARQEVAKSQAVGTQPAAPRRFWVHYALLFVALTMFLGSPADHYLQSQIAAVRADVQTLTKEVQDKIVEQTTENRDQLEELRHSIDQV